MIEPYNLDRLGLERLYGNYLAIYILQAYLEWMATN